jgi:hypothetical protein
LITQTARCLWWHQRLCSMIKMTKPMYDLILGCDNTKELGIVLNFWAKEITIDEITLPMWDVNSPTKSKWRRPGQ